MSLRLARRRITAYTDSNRAIPLLIRQVLPSEANAVELFAVSVFEKHLPEIHRAPIALGDGKLLTVYVSRLRLPLRTVSFL